MKRLVVSIPLFVGILIAAFVWYQQDPPSSVAEPVEIASTQSTYATLPELLDNTTVAVVGTVEKVERGQTYTDPTNPDAGFVSQLSDVSVETTLFGASTSEIIVEEGAALLDGTPIVVDGAEPLAVGDRVVLFLVEGATEQNRHFGVAGPQGRYDLDSSSGSQILRAVALSGGTDTPSFDGLELEEVIRRINLQ